MSQRTIRRICVLVVLVLTLALAGSTRADAAPRLGSADLWRWLENFWQERLVLLVRAEPAPSQSGARPQSPEKNCTTVDPNGCPSAPAGGGPGMSGGD